MSDLLKKLYARSILGTPVELSLDAPKDKIVIHPDLMLAIENRAIVVTSIEVTSVDKV